MNDTQAQQIRQAFGEVAEQMLYLYSLRSDNPAKPTGEHVKRTTLAVKLCSCQLIGRKFSKRLRELLEEYDQASSLAKFPAERFELGILAGVLAELRFAIQKATTTRLSQIAEPSQCREISIAVEQAELTRRASL